jgi:hypothetical protein
MSTIWLAKFKTPLYMSLNGIREDFSMKTYIGICMVLAIAASTSVNAAIDYSKQRTARAMAERADYACHLVGEKMECVKN